MRASIFLRFSSLRSFAFRCRFHHQVPNDIWTYSLRASAKEHAKQTHEDTATHKVTISCHTMETRSSYTDSTVVGDPGWHKDHSCRDTDSTSLQQTVESRLLFCGCLTSQQIAECLSGTCLDNCTCCHIKTEAADLICYLTQIQYRDHWPASPSANPITPDGRQCRSLGVYLATKPLRWSVTHAVQRLVCWSDTKIACAVNNSHCTLAQV